MSKRHRRPARYRRQRSKPMEDTRAVPATPVPPVLTFPCARCGTRNASWLTFETGWPNHTRYWCLHHTPWWSRLAMWWKGTP